MHKPRLPEANRDCEARFSARGGPLGVHQISSAPPAVASYLVRVETMIFSRSGSAYAGTECAPELNGLVELALFVKGGAHPTPVIDRFWFMSVYFREPGGVLFELATDGAGFGVDENRATLGESLVLPPWLEPNRAAIKAGLPKLVAPSVASMISLAGRWLKWTFKLISKLSRTKHHGTYAMQR
jgi:hypothetical protein